MALSGLDIYKLLPKTNCKQCGFPTCLAFAMQLAAKKVALDKCPFVTEEAKAALEGASQPPIKLVSFGWGDKKVEVGNETVLFRHEETFYHPTGIGVLLEDTLSAQELSGKIARINNLAFERVGKHIEIDIVALKQINKNALEFANFVKEVSGKVKFALLLLVKDAESARLSLQGIKDKRPLLYSAHSENYEEMAAIAKSFDVPLVVYEKRLEALSELTQKIKSLGVSDLILDTGAKPIADKIFELTQIRRLAIKKNFRPLGYPTIAFTKSDDASLEAIEAATYIDKFASIVIMKNIEPECMLSVLTTRQDIYTDPQQPTQVEPKAYEIGSVNSNSPVLITTNFSITYFTVASEVESSRVPSYLVSVDTEGMSVLTAWAAEKLTSEKIIEALKSADLENKVTHRKLILPGYVSVLSGKLQDESGWEVIVGPKEAANIPAFFKTL
ncbi:MAG: acetyl-CoA decarbonylase/synthase complex subunit gamma [Candidatus Omnitrophota bacterium]